jgi:hypothetical protein
MSAPEKVLRRSPTLPAPSGSDKLSHAEGLPLDTESFSGFE